MKEIFTVVSVVCASALICTLVSTFVTDGSTKKIINLVLGAFMICCLVAPIKNAVTGIEINTTTSSTPDSVVSTDDEAYSKAVLTQTRQNLESTLTDLLLQNSVKINSCKIIIAQSKENSIIISSISIYISKEYTVQSDNISGIVMQNFGLYPNIFTE